jgi:hypothetical protein
MAKLDVYMREVAKGNVTKLAQYTKELTDKLNAAGETSTDLLSNVIKALKYAPDDEFQIWLLTEHALWSSKKKNWRQDASDLLEDAEALYQERKDTGEWGKKSKNRITFAFTTMEDEDTKPPALLPPEPVPEPPAQYTDHFSPSWVAAVAAEVNKYSERAGNRDKYYKWKLVPPKQGESPVKHVLMNGEKLTYYWCTYHNMWTRHQPQECKRYPIKRGRIDKVTRKDEFKKRKKAYINAKAALQAMSLLDSSDDDFDDTASEGSNKSFSSDEDSNKS